VLTYFLSGLSGSASTPKFVILVERFGAWSFIKFSAGLSGILTAEVLTKLPDQYFLYPSEFVLPLAYICGAFAYAWLQIILFEESSIDPQHKWPTLRAINDFFTRHSRSEPPPK
jgi:hypothetical protein